MRSELATAARPSVIGPRNWTREEGTFVLARGGGKMGEDFKAKNIGIVRVRVADKVVLNEQGQVAANVERQFDIAYLLRDDENVQIRIGVFAGHDRRSRRERWEVIAVARHRIQEMTKLS